MKSPTCPTAARATGIEQRTGVKELLALGMSQAGSGSYTPPPSAEPSPSCNLRPHLGYKIQNNGQVQHQLVLQTKSIENYFGLLKIPPLIMALIRKQDTR